MRDARERSCPLYTAKLRGAPWHEPLEVQLVYSGRVWPHRKCKWRKANAISKMGGEEQDWQGSQLLNKIE